MEQVRKPFQGISNVFRFNWHFYVLAFLFSILFFLSRNYLCYPYASIVNIIFWLVIAVVSISLLATFYIYDLSDLYQLSWLYGYSFEEPSKIVNIHAGFDETSSLLKKKYPHADLYVYDFYDPLKHTEISIKRARKAYPAYPDTLKINTSNLPLPDDSIDAVFVILAAHEIRNENERRAFFIELKRIIKPSGRIFITEHLRDISNFMVYNIGFLHFIPKRKWHKSFDEANLQIEKKVKVTPFITTYILKNGFAS